MSADEFLIQFHDFLAPKLDTYEQAIYLYIYRHSRLIGLDEVVLGFKSARKRLAIGTGQKGSPMAEGTCYEKISSLQAKGCIEVISEPAGSRYKAQASFGNTWSGGRTGATTSNQSRRDGFFWGRG